MKRIFLILICGLLIGCGGQSNYGANAVIKGRILRPDYSSTFPNSLPPGANNTNAFVYIEGVSGYTGRSLLAYINPDDGSFSISINLGVKSLGPPVEYNDVATFDLKLCVNGIWWIQKVTDTEAISFMSGLPVEADEITDIGDRVLDCPVTSFWK